MTLVLKSTSYLVGTTPQPRTQLHGLGEVLDSGWHGILLGMSKVMALTMWVIYDKMLIEEYRIKYRNVLYCYQVLVLIQCFNSVVTGSMILQPVKQWDVFLFAITSQVMLVDKVVHFLTGIRRPELLGHFISPGYFDG